MKIEKVRVVGKAVKVGRAEVEALEERLWVKFPKGYAEYVTRLGEGVLGGVVRIYPPWRIEKELDAWRRRVEKYWFWDKGREVLPKERGVESVIIGDTVAGDEMVFHPGRPGRVFVLPRESEAVFEVGENLIEAVGWMLESGELMETVEAKEFDPFDSRAEAAEEGAGKVVDPQGESLDEIVELGKRRAVQHGVRQRAEKELKPYRERGKAELVYEGILLDGSPDGSGYAAAWKIVDAKGKQLGMFRWHDGGDSYGSVWEPG
jgi:hypothetical protein